MNTKILFTALGLCLILMGVLFVSNMDKVHENQNFKECDFEPTHFKFISGNVLSAVEGLENTPNFKGYKLSDYGGCN